MFSSFCHTFNEKNEKSSLELANVQSRLRMLTLYYYANTKNYLVVGTGNKIEDFGIGFFTKYGDGGVDLQPIADLTKSEVYLISNELNILDEIKKAKPKDGLWEDQRSDETQLGFTYEELEWAMKMNKIRNSNFSKKELKILKKYEILNQKNNHKMISIPFCKIPPSLKN